MGYPLSERSLTGGGSIFPQRPVFKSVVKILQNYVNKHPATADAIPQQENGYPATTG